MNDAAGQPKLFGFAEYADAQGVFRALRLLNGIELRSPEGRDVKKLSVFFCFFFFFPLNTNADQPALNDS